MDLKYLDDSCFTISGLWDKTSHFSVGLRRKEQEGTTTP